MSRISDFILSVSLIGVSCGSGTTSPSAMESISGTWRGTATLIGASGGECQGSDFATAVGASLAVDPFPIAQTGDNITMRLPLIFSAADCAYSGIATATGFTLAAANCGTYPSRRCHEFPGDGRLRDISFAAATFSGSVTGNILSATAVETWNVYVAGTQTSAGSLMLTTRFNLTR
jgi:hypothetical protein